MAVGTETVYPLQTGNEVKCGRDIFSHIFNYRRHNCKQGGDLSSMWGVCQPPVGLKLDEQGELNPSNPPLPLNSPPVYI